LGVEAFAIKIHRMDLKRYITYGISRSAAPEVASVTLVGGAVGAGKNAGGRKGGDSQHEGREGTREHLEFVKVFEGCFVRRTKVCSTEDFA
jgi:hypothetical protein